MEKLVADDPQRIGAYRLLARLGAGGMGQVYLARSDRGRTVAVKLVHQELAEQEQFRSRFRQEVAAARRVGGTWTAPVLDADTEAPVPWVATGYVAGPSLHMVVSGRPGGSALPADGAGGGHGPLPERSVRILASGLAHALQDIHGAGLIHRDLKPSNVLVTIDGPRVIDFGIARALETVADEVTGESLTRTGTLIGSPGFMAPEQVRGDRVTAACDVFCLGSVLAYAATGRPPFGAADTSVHALMFRIAQEEPDLTGLPEVLAELVRGCLEKDPAARPTTRDVLARVGEAADSGAGPGGEPWLPGGLLAQLGRHAVELLEYEDPTGRLQRPGPGVEVPSEQTLRLAPTPPAPAPTPRPVAPAAPATAMPDRAAQAPAAQAQVPAPAQAQTPAHAQVPAQAQTPAPAPAPQPYGYPQPGYGPLPPPPAQFGPTPPYGTAPTYVTPPEPEPTPRSTRATIALIAVAVVVAIGAGGSVYAFMDGGGTKDDKSTRVSGTADPTPAADDPAAPSSQPSVTPSPTPSEAKKGDVPTEYLGTWTGGVETDAGHSGRRLVIQQGKVGDTVLSLTVDGPPGDGTYHCVFEAPLASAPSPEEPLRIGPSNVTTGEPMSACTPGTSTELTIQPDGSLSRVTTSGESLTYTKEN
ncbi:serine/threonine-protein kinase [Streptomyces sp. NPDC102274]|uniref:serine/threonine-protein kinase n=1 Tax=Streptomyces sp. NPDC102274 TaxID=3366151 RepID=UPI00380C57DE